MYQVIEHYKAGLNKYSVFSSFDKSREAFSLNLEYILYELKEDCQIEVPKEMKARWLRSGLAKFSQLPGYDSKKFGSCDIYWCGVFKLEEGTTYHSGNLEELEPAVTDKDSQEEDKAAFVKSLLPLVQATRAGADVVELEYCCEDFEESEFVKVKYDNGGTKLLNITGNGCLAIMREVSERIV